MNRLLAFLFLFGLTALPQAPDSYPIRLAGCAARAGFMNTACLTNALNLGVTTGASVLCGDGGGAEAPAVYEFEGPIDIHNTRSVRFFGQSKGGCILQDVAAAHPTTASLRFWRTYTESHDVGSEVSHLTIRVCRETLAALQLDQQYNFHVDDVRIELATDRCQGGSGFSGPAPHNGILGRGWQLSSFERSNITYGFSSGFRLEALASPDVFTWKAGTTYKTGDITYRNDRTYVATSPGVNVAPPAASHWAPLSITTDLTPASTTVGVSPNCTWFHYQRNILMFPNGTYVRIVSCTGSTATLANNANITGYAGNQLAIGDEQTPVTVTAGKVETAGTPFNVGFAIASDMKTSTGTIYGVTTSCAMNFNATWFVYGNVYCVGSQTGIAINSTSVFLHGIHTEENSVWDLIETGTNSYAHVEGVQNLISTSVTGVNFMDATDSHFVCCGIGGAPGKLVTDNDAIVRIRDGYLGSNGFSIRIGSKTETCNNISQIGSTRYEPIANNCRFHGPTEISPDVSATAPSLTVRPDTFDGAVANGGGGKTATVIRLEPRGPTAVQLSSHVFLHGDGSSTGWNTCTTVNCAAGTASATGNTYALTWVTGDQFIRDGAYSWVNGSVYYAGVNWLIRSVSSCADTVDGTSCTVLGTDPAQGYPPTPATACGGRTACPYSTTGLTWSPANGGKLSIPLVDGAAYQGIPGGTLSCTAGSFINSAGLAGTGVLTLSCAAPKGFTGTKVRTACTNPAGPSGCSNITDTYINGILQ